MNFHPPDMHAIIGALGDGVEPNLAKRRRTQQNWMAVHNYGTAEFWARLQAPQQTNNNKQTPTTTTNKHQHPHPHPQQTNKQTTNKQTPASRTLTCLGRAS
jgi:hypothetical protein